MNKSSLAILGVCLCAALLVFQNCGELRSAGSLSSGSRGFTGPGQAVDVQGVTGIITPADYVGSEDLTLREENMVDGCLGDIYFDSGTNPYSIQDLGFEKSVYLIKRQIEVFRIALGYIDSFI